MQTRELATTIVVSRNAKRTSVSTVIPKAALSIVGASNANAAEWVRRGSYYVVIPGRTASSRPDGMSRRIQKKTRDVTIPIAVARDLRVRPGSMIDWLVGLDRSGRWEIHARRAGRRSARVPDGPAGTRTFMAPLFYGIVKRYRTRDTWAYHVSAPRTLFRILGVRNPSYVRWIRTGSGVAVMPCKPGDQGARVVSSKTNKTSGRPFRSSFVLHPPSDVCQYLASKRGGFTWWLYGDGRGGWEIRAVPGAG